MKRHSAQCLGSSSVRLGVTGIHFVSNTSDDHIAKRPMPDSLLPFLFLLCHSCRSHVLLASSRTINLDTKASRQRRFAMATQRKRGHLHGFYANAIWQEARDWRRKRIFWSDYRNQITKPEAAVGGTVYPEEHHEGFRKKVIGNRLGLHLVAVHGLPFSGRCRRLDFTPETLVYPGQPSSKWPEATMSGGGLRRSAIACGQSITVPVLKRPQNATTRLHQVTSSVGES